jgi:hypothetical protein
MDFLQKIEPHLLSDDKIVQRFVMHALKDYPMVPAEWTAKLLKEAIENKEKETDILVNLYHFPFDRDALAMAVRGAEEADPMRKHLYLSLLQNQDPELMLKNRDLIEKLFSKEMLEENESLLTCDEEDLWKYYASSLAALEKEQYYNSNLYHAAKEIARLLVQRGFVATGYLDEVFKEQENEPFFNYEGILAVYMVGLLKLEQYVPFLAGLLDRDEDILLEELARALTVFQSAAVAENIHPDLIESGMCVFPISILGDTKTEQSIEKLLNLYPLAEDDETKMYIVEALCHQLSEKALPIVQDAIAQDYDTYAYDKEELYYGFYKVMDVQHPQLEDWEAVIIENKIEQEKRRKLMDQGKFPGFAAEPVKNEVKVGRNDPCTCGSGKKYKKCCGK